MLKTMDIQLKHFEALKWFRLTYIFRTKELA